MDTPEAEAAALKYIQDRYNSSRDFDRGFKAAAMDDLLYLNSVLPKNWPFYWGLFYPETLGASRDVVEHTLGGFFEQEEIFGVRGEDGQDELISELNKERLKADLRTARYKLAIYYWFQEAVHFGNGWCYTGNEIGTKNGALDVRTIMRAVSRFDMFPGELGAGVQEMPYCLWREWVPLAVFRQRARWYGWAHADEVQGSYTLDSTTRGAHVEREDVWDDLNQRLKLMGYDVRDGRGSTHGLRQVELVHYYEKAADGEVRGYGILADGKYVVRCAPKPGGVKGYPLQDLKFAPLPAGGAVWHGLGVPALIRTYQDETNIRSAQEADATEYYLHPRTLVEEGAIDRLSRLQPYPGAIIPTQRNEGIETAAPPAIPPSMTYNRERATTGIMRMTKINDIARGLGPQGRGADQGTKTATGMQLLTNQSARAAIFQMLFNDEQGIEAQLNDFNTLSVEAMIQDREVDVTDNPKLEQAGMQGKVLVSPELLAGNWRVYLVGSTRAVQSPEQAQAFLDILKFFSDKPGVAERINWLKVFESVAPMIVHRGLNNFLLSDEEVQVQEQGQMQKAVAMAQLQAMTGGGRTRGTVGARGDQL